MFVCLQGPLHSCVRCVSSTSLHIYPPTQMTNAANTNSTRCKTKPQYTLTLNTCQMHPTLTVLVTCQAPLPPCYPTQFNTHGKIFHDHPTLHQYLRKY